MTEETFHAYAAGFFEAEGSFCISRVKMEKFGFQDNHRLILDVGQHVDRIDVLHRLQAAYGGKVSIRKQNAKSFVPGASIANWHLQKRVDVERFIRAILPYMLCKRRQAEIALRFLEEATTSEAIRTSGRFGGRNPLTAEQMDTRERIRLEMSAANLLSNSKPRGRRAQSVSVE